MQVGMTELGQIQISGWACRNVRLSPILLNNSLVLRPLGVEGNRLLVSAESEPGIGHHPA
jgi:hypothetical protein